ncbi:MAG: peptide chain release factor 2 [Gammaproteobacteria bacterium]|nr:peptide chain release factor 2 [Gammaproteobacteria bacterium]
MPTWPCAWKPYGGIFDYAGKRRRLAEVETELADSSIWADAQRAGALGRERASLKSVVEVFDRLAAEAADLSELLDLALAEQDEATLADVGQGVEALAAEVEQLEFRRMFGGAMDASNAFLEVTAGSGGHDAQDFAEMLLRMYLKFCEQNGFEAELIEASDGEVAGIKSAAVHVRGDYAYGWLRTETGVHRLVRKSPFDSGARRHTSFASVFVSPEIEEEGEVEIDPGDLRIDVYRASGAGGQHVNRTESAVRITHLPTSIVVQCQNERSQHKNRATAMKQLRAKLFELAERERRAEQQALEDSKADIGWGNQIRSYVLDQSRVKDLRTGVESSNPTAVLNGALGPFIEAGLKQGV